MKVIRRKHGHWQLPTMLPCGCTAIYRNEKTGTRGPANGTMVLEDGSRVCKKHGKRWRLAVAWQESKDGEV